MRARGSCLSPGTYKSSHVHHCSLEDSRDIHNAYRTLAMQFALNTKTTQTNQKPHKYDDDHDTMLCRMQAVEAVVGPPVRLVAPFIPFHRLARPTSPGSWSRFTTVSYRPLAMVDGFLRHRYRSDIIHALTGRGACLGYTYG
jgi:hypothetical protein